MEKKTEISHIPQKEKRPLPRSSAKGFDTTEAKEYQISSPKRSISTPKNSIPRKYSKKNIYTKKYVERNDDNIESIFQDKENNLLNLIVKTIVKSTLEKLYGKESY